MASKRARAKGETYTPCRRLADIAERFVCIWRTVEVKDIAVWKFAAWMSAAWRFGPVEPEVGSRGALGSSRLREELG
jgi:hypothetical protein